MSCGLYIHIPFCVKKCAYCDFPSFAGRMGEMPAYLRALHAELRARADSAREIDTVYIGGGTPSLLPPLDLRALMQTVRACYRVSSDAEISCECNPGTLTDAFCDALCQSGVNRVSLGMQAAQDGLLEALGRIHRFPDVVQSVRMLRARGITNINLDVMFGLPRQTRADARESLERALELSPEHLSCYGLIVEEGTPFARMQSRGELPLPDADTERDMYDGALLLLAQSGYHQYEISNFACSGYECRHNVGCWTRQPYIGAGSSACGFDGRYTRYANTPDIDRYIAGEQPDITMLSQRDARFESVMLGLRMNRGVPLDAFERMHGVTIFEAFGDKLKQPVRDGLLEITRDSMRLTRRGMDVQNRVLVALMD